MKFLVDAQLPERIAAWLTAAGCDTVHTLDLPDANRTTDAAVAEVADLQGRAVVTKDADFVDSHLLYGRPVKLLLITTGNIGNRELEAILGPLVPMSCASLQFTISSNSLDLA